MNSSILEQNLHPVAPTVLSWLYCWTWNMLSRALTIGLRFRCIFLPASCPQQLMRQLNNAVSPPVCWNSSKFPHISPTATHLGFTSTPHPPPPAHWDSWQSLDWRPLSLDALGKQVNDRSQAHWPWRAAAFWVPPLLLTTLSQRSVIQKETLCCWKAKAGLKCHIPQGLWGRKIHQSFSFINY